MNLKYVNYFVGFVIWPEIKYDKAPVVMFQHHGHYQISIVTTPVAKVKWKITFICHNVDKYSTAESF